MKPLLNSFCAAIITVLLIGGCVATEEPRVCCKALTAECLACADGVSVEEYCAQQPGRTGCGERPEPSRDGYVACTEPRPEICTAQYDPVCAQADMGVRCIRAPCPATEWRTYGNGCGACRDEEVLGYVPGECSGEQNARESVEHQERQ